jgi:chorismate synthase
LSGWYEGQTLGTPLALIIENEDHQSGAYDHLKDIYRPSHADYTTQIKYGIRAHEGGGRASARETVGRVAAGSVARKVLREHSGIEILAWVKQIHNTTTNIDPSDVTLEMVESNDTRCPDPVDSESMRQAILNARKDGNSLGGVVECVARNVPVGLGDPVFGKLEAELAKAMMSLPASKGFEIGSGFSGASMTGREHNDLFETGPSGNTRTTTNNSGGIQGGISNGEDILLRVAFKPTATIASSQQTIDKHGNTIELSARGRHDPCVLPRAVPMVEAMACLAICDALLRQASVDIFPKMQ